MDDSEDMFKSACTDMNIDVKKMPLGQLSKAQVHTATFSIFDPSAMH